MILNKRVTAAFFMMAVSSFSQAQMTEQERQKCSAQSSNAEQVMNARQVGVPMRDLMDAAAESPLTQLFVKWAFDKPRYSSPEYQQKQVTDFGNLVYQLCMERTEDNK